MHFERWSTNTPSFLLPQIVCQLAQDSLPQHQTPLDSSCQQRQRQKIPKKIQEYPENSDRVDAAGKSNFTSEMREDCKVRPCSRLGGGTLGLLIRSGRERREYIFIYIGMEQGKWREGRPKRDCRVWDWSILEFIWREEQEMGGKEFSTTISTTTNKITLTDFSTSKYSERFSNSLVVF